MTRVFLVVACCVVWEDRWQPALPQISRNKRMRRDRISYFSGQSLRNLYAHCDRFSVQQNTNLAVIFPSREHPAGHISANDVIVT